MKKIVALITLFCVGAFGCALCALQTPTAHITLGFQTKEKVIKNISVKWLFSQTFTTTLYYGYDLDDNKKFDKDEIKEIKRALVNYIQDKHFLMELGYYDKSNETLRNLPILAKNLNLTIENDQILFTYDLPQSVKLANNRVIKVQFLDDEGYFNFKIINDKPFKLNDFSILPNTNFNTAFFEIHQQKEAKKKLDNPPTKDIKSVLKPQQQIQNGFYAFLTQKLKYFTTQIKSLFSQSKHSPLALFTLMLFSFAYGLFHAAGPGHGKTLVGSYFLANGGSYLRAFWICVKIGFIHVIGAFLLVLASVYLVQTFVSELVKDVTRYTTIFASVVILILAFYLIYKKITNKQTNTHSCNICDHVHEHSHHDHEHHKHHKHDKKQEWGIALAAGLVPCPGTVAIFILAFTFGNYLSGFLSAIALALGMSTIIFVVSIFGNFIHVKTSKSFSSLLGKVEYIGLGLLVVLGLVMLISTFNFGV